jgi:hypothetical protein
MDRNREIKEKVKKTIPRPGKYGRKHKIILQKNEPAEFKEFETFCNKKPPKK